MTEEIEKIISEVTAKDDKLIERHECYGYPPRVGYRVT